MEHRWGRRKPVNAVICIKWRAAVVAHGQLTNVSISGALATTDARPPLWSRVEVQIEWLGTAQPPSPPLPAYVVRHTADGIGLEWCEFAPAATLQWLSGAAVRPIAAELQLH